MDTTRRTQLIRQSAVAISALRRMQIFTELAGQKINELQLNFDDLKSTFDRYCTAQINWNYLRTNDFGNRELFGKLYYEFKAKFSDLIHPVIDTPRSRNSSLRSLSTEAFLAALRCLIARRWRPSTICSDNVSNVQSAANELHANYKMLQLFHRWQQYKISWPLKDANGNSFQIMDLTSGDYGKQK